MGIWLFNLKLGDIKEDIYMNIDEYKPSVCMCVYKRVNNLPKIVKALEKQTYKYFDFNVWCNNISKLEKVKDILNNSKLNYNIYFSDKNEGSKSRFWLVPKCNGNPIMFFDDDQIPMEDYVEYLLKAYIKNPYSVQGYHNRVFTIESYWRKSSNRPEGMEVDYVGTGGMVVGREIVLDKRAQSIESVCSNVEDLYLSYIARSYGYKLLSLERKVELLIDKKDQFSGLRKEKENCFKYLRKLGFRLLKDQSNE